jgi:hypothetical protein
LKTTCAHVELQANMNLRIYQCHLFTGLWWRERKHSGKKWTTKGTL